MSEPAVTATRSATDRDGKHLTLMLGKEEYGVAVRDVREIVGPMPITPVPGTAAHVLGVVNLRGKVVPVLDLRARLGLPRATIAPRSCIVVCQGPAGQIGLLVDSVLEVVAIPESDCEPRPVIAGDAVTALAKVLSRGGVADEKRAKESLHSVIETVRSGPGSSGPP